jgi:hypothetical protein
VSSDPVNPATDIPLVGVGEVTIEEICTFATEQTALGNLEWKNPDLIRLDTFCNKLCVIQGMLDAMDYAGAYDKLAYDKLANDVIPKAEAKWITGGTAQAELVDMLYQLLAQIESNL